MAQERGQQLARMRLCPKGSRGTMCKTTSMTTSQEAYVRFTHPTELGGVWAYIAVGVEPHMSQK